MSTVTHVALLKAVSLLHAAGAKYHIISADGHEHRHGIDAVPAAPQKKTKPPSKRMAQWTNEGRAVGDLARHIRPYLTPMKAGEVAVVPFGRFVHTVMASSVSANAIHMWGKGNAIIARQPNGVEILRVG